MSQPVTLLGATGSIGRSTLDVVRKYPDRFHIHAVAGGHRVKELAEVCREYHPKHAVIADEDRYAELKDLLIDAGLSDICVHAGPEAVSELSRDPETRIVVQAIVGAAGVVPTFAAAEAGKRLLLANKESVVCGGELLMKTVAARRAELIPVDSEHSAIFQCLQGASEGARKGAKLILTASGGPFRGRKDLRGITPLQAIQHPKWSMGRKISVDSATLMNKGLEVIEAARLFGFAADRIDVVVHPQSVVHSAVEFEDGALIAQLGSADMRTPIAYALGWPERMDGRSKRLSLTEIGKLTFEEPDRKTFPLLDMAYEALKTGSADCIVLNAANEVAVEWFLANRISFTAIFRIVGDMLERIRVEDPSTLDEIMALDRQVRTQTREHIISFIMNE